MKDNQDRKKMKVELGKERMTKRLKDGSYELASSYFVGDLHVGRIITEVINRLGMYEDKGFTPDDVTDVVDMMEWSPITGDSREEDYPDYSVLIQCKFPSQNKDEEYEYIDIGFYDREERKWRTDFSHAGIVDAVAWMSLPRKYKRK